MLHVNLKCVDQHEVIPIAYFDFADVTEGYSSYAGCGENSLGDVECATVRVINQYSFVDDVFLVSR